MMPRNARAIMVSAYAVIDFLNERMNPTAIMPRKMTRNMSRIETL
jgi:hypothetical protein